MMSPPIAHLDPMLDTIIAAVRKAATGTALTVTHDADSHAVLVTGQWVETYLMGAIGGGWQLESWWDTDAQPFSITTVSDVDTAVQAAVAAASTGWIPGDLTSRGITMRPSLELQ